MNIWIPVALVAGAAVPTVLEVTDKVLSSPWASVATALIVLLTPLITAWATRIAAKKAVEEGVDKVVKQNERQEKKIDAVAHDQDHQHGLWNSRLDEWKKEQKEHMENAIELALERGKKIGIEAERKRVPETAEKVIETAKGAAEDLLAVAEAKKDEEK